MQKIETTSLQTTIPLTTTLFYLTIFAIPMINHAHQLIIGTAVNTILFLGAQKLDTDKELIPLAVLPSLGAIANGALFGSFTVFLLYFVPAIWVSNFVLMKLFKELKSHSIPMKLVVSSLMKAAILFITAITLFKFGVVPKIFITAMGLVQVITALAGGTLALLIGKSKFMKE